jgi:hypothetical protein
MLNETEKKRIIKNLVLHKKLHTFQIKIIFLPLPKWDEKEESKEKPTCVITCSQKRKFKMMFSAFLTRIEEVKLLTRFSLAFLWFHHEYGFGSYD